MTHYSRCLCDVCVKANTNSPGGKSNSDTSETLVWGSTFSTAVCKLHTNQHEGTTALTSFIHLLILQLCLSTVSVCVRHLNVTPLPPSHPGVQSCCGLFSIDALPPCVQRWSELANLCELKAEEWETFLYMCIPSHKKSKDALVFGIFLSPVQRILHKPPDCEDMKSWMWPTQVDIHKCLNQSDTMPQR